MFTICSLEPSFWYQGVQCTLPVTVFFRHLWYVEGAHSSLQLRREIGVLSWVYFNLYIGGPWFLDVRLFICQLQTFVHSWWTNISSYHTVVLSISKANVSVFAWSQQCAFIKQCSFVLARNSCKHHTMPTCSHSSGKMCSFHIYSHTCPHIFTCLRPWNRVPTCILSPKWPKKYTS